MRTDPFPIIDFNKANLRPGSPEWELMRSEVRKAAEEYGCFRVLYDRIPMETRQATFREAKELFDLPLETKKRNVPDVPYGGYLGIPHDCPILESIGFHDSDGSLGKTAERFAYVFWPQGRPSFSKTLQSFSCQAVELEKMVKRMIVESFGLEKYWDELSNSVDYLFKVFKYELPQTEAKDKAEGLEAHKDKTSVTILYQNEVDGLEVEGKNGEWIKVKFTSNHFFVIIGDSFRAWTNNQLSSANHRVILSGKEARYSVGLFSGFKSDYVIKAPDELVDEQHPRLFKPYKFHDFAAFERTKEQESILELEAFCGV